MNRLKWFLENSTTVKLEINVWTLISRRLDFEWPYFSVYSSQDQTPNRTYKLKLKAI